MHIVHVYNNMPEGKRNAYVERDRERKRERERDNLPLAALLLYHEGCSV